MHGLTKDRESFPRACTSQHVDKLDGLVAPSPPRLQRNDNQTTSVPFVCAALGCGQPSEEVALRRVMSTVNWAPWSIGSPDARTSIALSSSTGTVTFMSLNLTLDRTTAPASRHTRAKVRSAGTALLFKRPERGHGGDPIGSAVPHKQRASVTWIGSLNLQRQHAECLGLAGYWWDNRATSRCAWARMRPGWAWSPADDWAMTTLFRIWCSEEEEALYCQTKLFMIQLICCFLQLAQTTSRPLVNHDVCEDSSCHNRQTLRNHLH